MVPVILTLEFLKFHLLTHSVDENDLRWLLQPTNILSSATRKIHNFHAVTRVQMERTSFHISIYMSWFAIVHFGELVKFMMC